MYYVYIIKSKDFDNTFYTGYTEDLKLRIEDHNNGKSPHTQKYKPWKLFYYCSFINKKLALDFEKYLKTASGIAFRNKRLVSSIYT